MLQTVSRLLPELPLILMTAVATHLVMSFSQTLMHYKLWFRHESTCSKISRASSPRPTAASWLDLYTDRRSGLRTRRPTARP